jgi:MFS family permease
MAAGTIGDVRLLAPLRERDFALLWTGMTVSLLGDGIFSDRVERRRVLIAADLARAAVLAVTGALSLAGVLEIWHLVALAVLYGAGEAFFGPAFGALVPEIVAPHHLVEANSLDQLVRQATGVDATLVVAGVAPMIVCVVLFVAAGLRREEELHPLLPAAVVS